MTHTTRRKLIDRTAIAGTAIAALIVTALLWPFGSDAGAGDASGKDAGGSAPALDVESDARITDGRHFGEISAAYVAPGELVFVPMEFLEGVAARQAAVEDGRPPDDTLDFYVRGLGVPAQSVPVAPDVQVTRVDCSGAGCVDGVDQSYEAFTLALESPDSAGRVFWIVITDDLVTEIHEQYLP